MSGVIEALAIHLASKRVRLETYFKDFDIHRKQVISPSQAMRAIVYAGFQITEEEMAELNEIFAVKESDGMIFFKYTELIKVIDDLLLPKPYDGTEVMTKEPPLSELHLSGRDFVVDTHRISTILSRLHYETITRALELKQQMGQYDRVGLVTRTQFLRAMANFSFQNINDAEIEELCNAYTLPNGLVSYLALSRDMRQTEVPNVRGTTRRIGQSYTV